MSFIGIKDLDLFLCNYLDDTDIFNLSHVNKYYYKLFNDQFYSNRYYKKYGKISELIPRQTNKKTYYENTGALQKTSLIAVEFAIIHDRIDLLILIYYFHEKMEKIKPLYDPTRFLYHPIELAIEYDSIECFKYLLVALDIHFIDVSIKYKSDKILRFICDKMKKNIFTGRRFYYCFEYDSPMFIQLYLRKNRIFEQELVDNVIYHITYPADNVLGWLTKHNSAFAMFVNRLTIAQLQDIVNMAEARDRHHVVQLIDFYHIVD